MPCDLFLRFARLDNDRKILRFAETFGLLNAPPSLGDRDDFKAEPLSDWRQAIADMNRALELKHQADRYPTYAALRLALHELVSRHLANAVTVRMTSGFGDRLSEDLGSRLPKQRDPGRDFTTCMVASSLRAFAWLELAESLSADSLRRCAYSGCREWFLVSLEGGSGRRADARTCNKRGNLCRTRLAQEFKARAQARLREGRLPNEIAAELQADGWESATPLQTITRWRNDLKSRRETSMAGRPSAEQESLTRWPIKPTPQIAEQIVAIVRSGCSGSSAAGALNVPLETFRVVARLRR